MPIHVGVVAPTGGNVAAIAGGIGGGILVALLVALVVIALVVIVVLRRKRKGELTNSLVRKLINFSQRL